ncbi:bifunctional [glutamine synthetase] adenylyltransferase/[glutamine synthetase]-adenylyl-L-tyrosine phosphorylase [Streptomyces sp. TS71-3]|uniref:bifunctional [glutamine synthetase] adenylyltransferase/[glutamine synthetase]-adenylyl-L-tyrosine phosphorylase n=1 Tax=Streptomyces sp. TS71-3 TaxID=2733862 RepID=UPI001B10F361|nr:bifunctional [glutamine synthetase] adenylyltransferase/[glutamine synthetase]-adenylyl-L-tyrosine phosphorylase [Streptomyces sp. TS71-3]GHJ38068.1 glutamate-ammonia-ligase adenylyltransferase [Streptomyces sp. TS71-3]
MTVPQGRRSSTFTRLLRLGFTDPSSAEGLLASGPLTAAHDDPVLLDALGGAADPDLALRSLARMAEAQPDEAALRELLDTLATAKPLRDRLLGVLGASEALGDHLARHPADWRALATYEQEDLHPGVAEFERGLAEAGNPVELRVAYRRCLLSIAARDVCGTTDVAETAAELADLATATLRAALAMAADQLPDDAAASRLAVIALGKCGGHELNYVSDVDVVYVAEPAEGVDEDKAVQAATRLAALLMRICSETTVEGSIWPVDANLRPEGRNGPLVRTLASHLAYYQRWAKTWEFQALLKARPVAGDEELGAAYMAAVSPLVWGAAERENFVADVQKMRRRIIENIPAGEVERELKLGPGGLRDVEFAVQLLQLVHGRADTTVRSPTTLEALRALAADGYVGRVDAVQLDDAYRFLRSVEHRVQLYRLRRTHLMPEEEADQRRIGRSLGMRTEPITELLRAWRRHTSVVRRLHEKLFYRPLLDAVAQLAPGETRLSTGAARERLVALGYADPGAALRHLEALASGVTRRAAIQRTLLPVLLGWFADSADPDAGLLNFRKVSDALGKTPWYLRLLRDEGAAAENLARVLSAGRLAPDLLMRAPEAVALLGGDQTLTPRGRAQLDQEILAAVGRADSGEHAVTVARAVRRRELFRTAAADLTASYGTEERPVGAEPAELVDLVGDAITDLTAATLAGTLRAVVRWGHLPRPEGSGGWGDELPTRFAVIGMGRFGGHELGYGSDADVIFVHEPREGVGEHEAARAAHTVVEEMRRLLQRPSADPPLLIDTGLRPEGKSGPLVRTLKSYEAYYRRWSLVWESQALLRAQYVAGDEDLARRFLRLVDPLRYPSRGLTEDEVREIRRLKARMESERLPRGADPALHTKLGRGGLSDVEWTVQLMQMRHASTERSLRTPRTRRALTAARDAGLLSERDASILDEAWVLATRVRNAVMLVRGRAGDTFPTEARELGAVARYLGYEPGHVGDMLEDYRRTTRRARGVVEHLFYES